MVGECGDGDTALEMIVRFRPEVAVLDISMPQGSGIEVTEEIAQRALNTRVVILTMYKSPALVRSAFNAGVSAFVLKDGAFDDVAKAIRTVAAGGTFISPSLASDLTNTEDVYRGPLTRREREILGMIARGKSGREMSIGLFISIKTVETHRRNIMRKLGVHSVAELVRYAVESGQV